MICEPRDRVGRCLEHRLALHDQASAEVAHLGTAGAVRDGAQQVSGFETVAHAEERRPVRALAGEHVIEREVTHVRERLRDAEREHRADRLPLRNEPAELGLGSLRVIRDRHHLACGHVDLTLGFAHPVKVRVVLALEQLARELVVQPHAVAVNMHQLAMLGRAPRHDLRMIRRDRGDHVDGFAGTGPDQPFVARAAITVRRDHGVRSRHAASPSGGGSTRCDWHTE